MTAQIDLSELAGDGRARNLSGKERGLAARRTLKLDELDAGDDVIEVFVPDYIDVISPSYFQGLFSESIKRLDGKENFLKKYRFVASPHVQRWIEVGIRNSTSSRDSLL